MSIEVSILTRPTGRVQPMMNHRRMELFKEFQSSPGLRAGCNSLRHRLYRRALAVSILTRPTGRVQLDPVFAKTASIEVSILTRPTGRVQLVHEVSRQAFPLGVSILTRPVGRVQLSYLSFLLAHREPPCLCYTGAIAQAVCLTYSAMSQICGRTSHLGRLPQQVRVTPPRVRCSQSRFPVHIPRLVYPGYRAACKT